MYGLGSVSYCLQSEARTDEIILLFGQDDLLRTPFGTEVESSATAPDTLSGSNLTRRHAKLAWVRASKRPVSEVSISQR